MKLVIILCQTEIKIAFSIAMDLPMENNMILGMMITGGKNMHACDKIYNNTDVLSSK